MVDIKLTSYSGYSWYSKENIFVKGAAFYKDAFLENEMLLQPFQSVNSVEAFQLVLKGLNGLFSVIILLEDGTVMAAVDPLRNFPLLYACHKGRLIITDDYRNFKNEIPLNINERSTKMMLSFGYTTKDTTLLNNVFQLSAGKFFYYRNAELTVDYWNHIPPLEQKQDRIAWKNELRQQILSLGGRLATALEGKMAVVPLSGGFDSRLLCLLLKLQNIDNVLCFTYGNPDYYEAKISKKIAELLGYKWEFIDYTPFLSEDYIHSLQFYDYADFAGNAMTFPYNQEFFAARYIKEKLRLPCSAVFLPGHSGDMVAGSHLFPDMKQVHSKHDVAHKIFRYGANHTCLSGKQFRNMLSEIEQDITMNNNCSTHQIHDEWNICERQSKQIVNSSKVWTFFGYKYLLPLWDKSLSDFVLSMPFEYRLFQNLYNELVCEIFNENNILLFDELQSRANLKEKYYSRLKLKTKFPSLLILKKALTRQPKDKFFFFDDFYAPMVEEIEPLPKYSDGTAVLSAWYIRHVKKEIAEISPEIYIS